MNSCFANLVILLHRNKMNLRSRIILSYIFLCIVWGTTWSIVKIGLGIFPPILYAALRFLIASIVLGLFVKKIPSTILKDRTFRKIVLILTLFEYSLSFVLMYFGQIYISSSLASVLFATFPLMVAIVTHYSIPDDRLNKRQYAGIIFGFIGVFVLFAPSSEPLSSSVILGMLAILLSAFLQSISVIVVRKYGQSYSSMHYNFLAMVLSTLLLLFMSFCFEDFSSTYFSRNGILSLLFLGIFGLALPYVIYFWLIKYLKPQILSLSAFITPLIAIAIGLLWLNETWTYQMTLGSIAVILGILITLWDTTLVKRIDHSS